jgi:hypothetical protein
MEAAGAWIKSFHRLVDNLRADFSNQALPIVFAQIASISQERRARREHGYAGWERLKLLQAAVNLPNVVMVKTDDLPLKSDGLHLSASAAEILGQRFAAAFLGIEAL